MTANDYQVHMLRIWRESAASNDGPGKFRVSLENTKTAVRVGFTDLDALVDYLRQQVDEPKAP